MAATNAVITRISFGVIMLQQSGLRRFLFGIAGIGENWKKGKYQGPSFVVGRAAVRVAGRMGRAAV
jgi:hypothetical protein